MILDQIKANMKLADKFFEDNMSDDVREILEENKAESESNWFNSYYSASVGQSVVNDFESGNIRVVKL